MQFLMPYKSIELRQRVCNAEVRVSYDQRSLTPTSAPPAGESEKQNIAQLDYAVLIFACCYGTVLTIHLDMV